MIGISKMKASFFDRAKVISATDRATRGVLSKFGAFVMRAAKSSIRKRKRASAPGKPPSSHTGILRKFIFFAYEAGGRGNVVIGPAKTNQLFVKGDAKKFVKGEVPEVLEYGGGIGIAEEKLGKNWYRIDLRRTPKETQKRVRWVHIAARPYMHPAFDTEKKKLPAMWANSIK